MSFINSYSQRFKYVKIRPGAILDEDVNDSLIDSQLKAQDTRSLVFNMYNSSLRLRHLSSFYFASAFRISLLEWFANHFS